MALREFADMLIFGKQYFLSAENWLSLFMIGIALYLYIQKIILNPDEWCKDSMIPILAAIGNMTSVLVTVVNLRPKFRFLIELENTGVF